MESTPRPVSLTALDDPTRRLVRIAAVLAGGSEQDVREALVASQPHTPPQWIEELILQTYLFAGFPRALNGMREWRRLQPLPRPTADTPEADLRAAGARTCARVYGQMYEKLRTNIRALHPLLDDWMIVEGYGKVLSRPGLDLPRRELCIVAACAATGQDRQLQSHLHGARNAGVADAVITAMVGALEGLISPALRQRAEHMWTRVRQ